MNSSPPVRARKSRLRNCFLSISAKRTQRGVAFQVAVPVVDAFEIIQVEEQQGRGVPALVDVKIGLDVLPGVVVIVQAGERVLAGALHQFVVAEFPVGDVQKNADVNPFTVLVRGQATFFQSPDQIAVGFSDRYLLVIVALRSAQAAGTRPRSSGWMMPDSLPPQAFSNSLRV